ncbi:hypothetical protein [Bradyrhizobium sp. CCGUVB23]|uniref:hypothetical protein n=1 Tax=Bradyrhizobium sp. CCGUVB23 TaxID=2949630 RepID=UPI0020B4519B|nr:hypothetical protein [Bradyrhizobium sp. CCGUVB23]MCP3459142.1 hypothetical protein [Bradyrhizobium sp. CCGUVB23]
MVGSSQQNGSDWLGFAPLTHVGFPLRLLDRGNAINVAPGASLQGGRMITAVVRYKLPPQIDCAACHEHFHKIAPNFREVTGLISKHFIWSESGWAGGVYQWERIEDAKAFYTGPWLEGIIQRYGMKPQIDLYEVFAVTDNARGKIELFKETVASK